MADDSGTRPASESPQFTRIYTDSVVRPADLGTANPVVNAMRFDRCLVLGPVVISFEGCTIESSTFAGPADAVLWEVAEDRGMLIGAVQFVDCTFVDCRFLNLGIVGTPAVIAEFREAIWAAGGGPSGDVE